MQHTHRVAWFALLAALLTVGRLLAAAPPAFTPAAKFAEQEHWETVDPGVRVYVNAPLERVGDDVGPTRLIFFALPNGNTIEQTLGCRMKPGLDWHFDIQHIAAQTRLLRKLTPDERIVLVCVEAPGLAWSAFRGKYPDGNARIGRIYDDLVERFGGDGCRVTLTGHSGGGSFDFGVIEAHDEIPAAIDRIAFLDSNYAFGDELHTEKLTRWLRDDQQRRLVVICYDDREITLGGKKVVGETGGTFRATERMIASLGPTFPFERGERPPFRTETALTGRVRFLLHLNPQNKILHTALVGDMNGLVHAQTLGTPREETWGQFGGPRAYEKWIQEESCAAPRGAREEAKDSHGSGSHATELPVRPADAVGGREFCRRIERLPLDEREAAIFREISTGNFPPFLRKFCEVPLRGVDQQGRETTAVMLAMPDCLAVGSDDDFVRMPMRPQTAQRLADLFGCTLPTRKIVDALDAAATVRLPPQPLTEDRESVAAFVLANDKSEAERAKLPAAPLGALTTGAKKDIVLSAKIYDKKPARLVIYGWRQLDGTPIQPLTNVHVDRYVDYSHGVRLVRRELTIAGRRERIDELLRDPARAWLASDEGPLAHPRYPE